MIESNHKSTNGQFMTTAVLNTNHTDLDTNTNSFSDRWSETATVSPIQSQSVSFFQRIIPFGNRSSVASVPVEKCSERVNNTSLCSNRKATLPEEKKTVQSLKQFWISAFGGGASNNIGNSVNKRVETCSSAKCAHRQNSEKLMKSATLRSTTTELDITNVRNKCLSLDRNASLYDNCCDGSQQHIVLSPVHNISINNFYKYKTADTVKNKRFCGVNDQGVDRSSNMRLMSTPSSELCAADETTTVDGQSINEMDHHVNLPEMLDDSDESSGGGDLNFKNKNDSNSIKINNENSDLDKNKCIKSSENPDLQQPISEITTSTMDVDNEKCEDKAAYSTAPTADKLSASSNSNQSKTSSTNSLVLSESLSSSSSPRKYSTTTLRKCSFRTNNFHAPHHFYNKKMATNGVSGSKVAALTHRFNQLIQQDADILGEVKRNKEMVLHRLGGRVYKIKEEPISDSGDSAKSGGRGKRGQSISKRSDGSDGGSVTVTSIKIVKKKPSVKRKSSMKSNRTGTITATIEICETTDHSAERTLESTNAMTPIEVKAVKSEKPKVPDKSAEVLQRTKEIVLLNSLKRTKLNRSLSPATDTKENEEKDSVQESRKLLENIKEVVEEKDDKSEVDVTVIESSTIHHKAEVTIELSNIESFSVDEAKTETSNTAPSNTDQTFNADETHSKTKKSRYSRLYEKLRFKTSQLSSRKPRIPEYSDSIAEEPIYISADQKIVDALNSVNQRIEHLSRSENCLISCTEIINNEKNHEDMDKNMKPNHSFLYRSNPATIFSGSHESVESIKPLEAINSVVINKTRSMEDGCFPTSQKQVLQEQISLEENNFNLICQRTDNLLHQYRDNMCQQDGYEVIRPCDNSEITEVDLEIPANSPDLRKTPNHSFIHNVYQKVHTNKTPETSETNVPKNVPDCSSIYQSISEIIPTKNANKDCDSVNSYESFENYEAVDEILEHIRNENGYEICDPPAPPEPPPPRKLSDQSGSPHPSVPQIPVPKRNPPQTSYPTIIDPQPNYEKIRYETMTLSPAPPRPPKSPNLTENTRNQRLPETVTDLRSVYSIDYRDYDYGENIYDTIKTVDTTSMATDYESISSAAHFLRSERNGMKHFDSMSTLSSDIKTNSLYGTSMCGQSVRPPSEGSSGDNSDEWIDISDGEGEKKHKFIVVCERKKSHRSPDWNQKVRDQRMNKQHQQQHQELYEDDSDHYYETLDTAETKQSSHYANTAKPSPAYPSDENLTNVETIIHDDFDSFDSEDETDEDIKKNDSGVDVSNTRLPDPPIQQSQVYSFMQKIKNFGSLSKSLTKLTKKKTSTTSLAASTTYDQPVQRQKYENTQFYVGNDYENFEATKLKNNKSKTKTPKMSKRKDTVSDPYENTEFHSPRTTTLVMPTTNTPAPEVTASSPILSHIDSTSGAKNTEPNGLSRKKSKSGKSFKSKFRLNAGTDQSINLGSSLNGNQSTFYVSDSVDVDSGIFSSTDKVPTTLDDSSGTDQSNVRAESSTLPKQSTTVSSPLVTMRPNKYSITSSTSSPEVSRRRSSLGIRPNNPPPPPPVDGKRPFKNKRVSTTSWYAECGVFKSDTLNESSPNNRSSKKDTKSTSSWYADAGLYQTSGASVASSSGSSGVSTGGEGGPGDDSSHSMFLNEPLYQIYSQAKLESLTKDIEMENDHSDGYEEIGGLQPPMEEEKKPLRPSALQLVGPKQGPSRTLWSEIPEVINSQILSTLTSTERRLQEAKFEILTSEASYLKSLTLLRTHFMNHPAFRDTSILTSTDRKTLFSYIVSVHECSDRLLCDLENCWQDNIMLLGLSHSVYKHAEKYFHVYVTYCEHQGKLDRTLKRLKETKPSFSQALEVLELDPVCCGLSLHSFLMLPMQRITRLPLLVDAVLSKLKLDDDEFESWKMTLAILNKIVAHCNEAANRSEQAFELEMVSRQIEFPPNIRPLAIVPVGVPAPGTINRSLVRRGELVHLIWRGDDGKLTFGKKFTKTNVYAFLFTDLIVLTKKRTDDTYTVFDYCQRSLLTISSGDVIPQLPAKELALGGKHLICMTLLENYEGKMIEMILSCPSETERQRWLNATEPPESENPDEKLYEQWDCPQVIAKHTYTGTQRDELNLDPGDIVNVTRKMADGWYHGERIRDGAHGWFPGNYTEEVASTHVRARNLKQRYRLLTFTAAYWESQKKK